MRHRRTPRCETFTPMTFMRSILVSPVRECFMKHFFSAVVLPAAVFVTAAATSAATAADGHSLMGIIAERRYPDSHLNRVQTADGKRINSRDNPLLRVGMPWALRLCALPFTPGCVGGARRNAAFAGRRALTGPPVRVKRCRHDPVTNLSRLEPPMSDVVGRIS